MNINTIKRFAFLALALALPSVASAKAHSIEPATTHSVEEARELYDIHISETGRECSILTINYPSNIWHVRNEALCVTSERGYECADGVVMEFLSLDGTPIRVEVITSEELRLFRRSGSHMTSWNDIYEHRELRRPIAINGRLQKRFIYMCVLSLAESWSELEQYEDLSTLQEAS